MEVNFNFEENEEYFPLSFDGLQIIDNTRNPVIKPLEVTENGEYTVPENVHGFNPVKVDVPLKYDEGYTDGYQASQDSIKLQEKTATENGEIVTDDGFTGMSKVTVAVPIKEEQEKNVDIVANGTVEITPDEGKVMSKVTANVNVKPTDVGKPFIDTSKIKDFSHFFKGDRLGEQSEQVDTSNGEIFSSAWESCSFEVFPNFETKNGKSFGQAFRYCSNLTTIEKLDTSKMTQGANMFYSCRKLKKLPAINLSNDPYLSGMFYSCEVLESVAFIGSCDFMTDSFKNCTSLKSVSIEAGWAGNIYLHYSNNLTVESLHGMIENLADLTGQTAKTFQIGTTNIAKIDEAHIQMLNDKNWTYS